MASEECVLAVTKAKQTETRVLLKYYYTVEDVHALLAIGENMVRELANRGNDPLPFRRLSGKACGMFHTIGSCHTSTQELFSSCSGS